MIRQALAAASALLAFAPLGQAQVETYVFNGVVGPAPIVSGPWTGVLPGDAICVTLSVDLATTGSPVGPKTAYPAILSTSVKIGAVTHSAPGAGGVFVLGDNVSSFSICGDSFEFQSTSSSAWDSGLTISLVKNGSTGNCPVALTSEAIPSSLNVGLFDTANFGILATTGGFSFIDATITSVTIGTGTPDGDDCADAIVLPSTFADTPYNAGGATTDGVSSLGICDYGGLGDQQNYRDIWFRYTPAIGGCTYISTFGLAGYDTRLTVYEGVTCPDDPGTIIACVNDEDFNAPFEAGLDVQLAAGTEYMIRLGTSDETIPPGFGTLRIAAGPGAAVRSGGANPGAPGCDGFFSFCNGDGGEAPGCTDCPCGNNAPEGTVGGCLNSTANSCRLWGTGDPSVSLPANSTSDLRFGLSGAPAFAFCILNSGDGLAPGNMANPCFGLNTGGPAPSFDGLRCAIINTRRHGGRAADPNGEVGVTNNPWGGEGGPPVGIAVAGTGYSAGQTRYFQVINRDDPLLGCMRALNTSQAVRVTFTP